MSPAAPTYVIVTRAHVAQFDPQLQEVVPGWQLKAIWSATGTVLPIFVPDQFYTPENVDTQIRAAGALDEQVHALGASTPAKPAA